MVQEKTYIIIIFILLIIIYILFKLSDKYRKDLNELKFKKQSQSVKYGQITEQFFPFMEEYPYEPKKFRFIGSPIDGISFNNKEIVFLEFKTGNSQLSENQEHIKYLVNNKQVRFEEMRI